jgi:hypothetical protein
MVVGNVGQHCIVVGDTVAVQAALSAVELQILRTISSQGSYTISALAAACGCGYSYCWFAVYRLQARGLLRVDRQGGALHIYPLAQVVDL